MSRSLIGPDGEVCVDVPLAGGSLRAVPAWGCVVSGGLPGATDASASSSRLAGDVSAFALEALITEVAAGDEGVFGCFYDQLAGTVWGVVCRVLRDRAQAEEVTQEVFTELWRTAGWYCPAQGSVTTWAVTVAHRRAVDRVRSIEAGLERERRVAVEASRQRPFDQVSDRVLDGESRRQVAQCLDRLTAREWDTVLLAYYGSLTCREIAETRQLPSGAVQSRMRDALRRLRTCTELGA